MMPNARLTLFARIAITTILLSGAFLAIAASATLKVALDVHHEQEVGRKNICDGRRLDGLPMTPTCRDFYKKGGF